MIESNHGDRDFVCEAVTVHYGSTVALQDISLKIQAGEHVVIAGANGAGKSTLARLLYGFQQPDTGRVTWGGSDVHRLPRARRNELLYFSTARPTPTEQFVELLDKHGNDRVFEYLLRMRISTIADERTRKVIATCARECFDIARRELPRLHSCINRSDGLALIADVCTRLPLLAGGHAVIFDEVDAPLDSSNEGGFYSVLDEIAAHARKHSDSPQRVTKVFFSPDPGTCIRQTRPSRVILIARGQLLLNERYVDNWCAARVSHLDAGLCQRHHKGVGVLIRPNAAWVVFENEADAMACRGWLRTNYPENPRSVTEDRYPCRGDIDLHAYGSVEVILQLLLDREFQFNHRTYSDHAATTRD